MTKVVRRKGTLSSSKKEKPQKEVAKDVKLPSSLSAPSSDLGDYSIFLYGREKIGKTTLAAQFPDALFLMFEPGGKALSIYQMAMTSWATFTKTLRLLETDTRFKTVVVDTVDIAFKKCEAAMCRKLGIEHPSDEDWGKGWTKVRDEFTDRMAALMSLGKGVILISHDAEREMKRRDGTKYHVIGPTLGKQGMGVVIPMIDIWCCYQFDGQHRILTVRGDEHVMAGVRPENVFMHDGKPMNDISMGGSADAAYKNFVAAFKNKYVPTSAAKKSTKHV